MPGDIFKDLHVLYNVWNALPKTRLQGPSVIVVESTAFGKALRNTFRRALAYEHSVRDANSVWACGSHEPNQLYPEINEPLCRHRNLIGIPPHLPFLWIRVAPTDDQGKHPLNGVLATCATIPAMIYTRRYRKGAVTRGQQITENVTELIVRPLVNPGLNIAEHVDKISEGSPDGTGTVALLNATTDELGDAFIEGPSDRSGGIAPTDGKAVADKVIATATFCVLDGCAAVLTPTTEFISLFAGSAKNEKNYVPIVLELAINRDIADPEIFTFVHRLLVRIRKRRHPTIIIIEARDAQAAALWLSPRFSSNALPIESIFESVVTAEQIANREEFKQQLQALALMLPRIVERGGGETGIWEDGDATLREISRLLTYAERNMDSAELTDIRFRLAAAFVVIEPHAKACPFCKLRIAENLRSGTAAALSHFEQSAAWATQVPLVVPIFEFYYSFLMDAYSAADDIKGVRSLVETKGEMLVLMRMLAKHSVDRTIMCGATMHYLRSCAYLAPNDYTWKRGQVSWFFYDETSSESAWFSAELDLYMGISQVHRKEYEKAEQTLYAVLNQARVLCEKAGISKDDIERGTRLEKRAGGWRGIIASHFDDVAAKEAEMHGLVRESARFLVRLWSMKG